MEGRIRLRVAPGGGKAYRTPPVITIREIIV
jgi:hypothetical protein